IIDLPAVYLGEDPSADRVLVEQPEIAAPRYPIMENIEATLAGCHMDAAPFGHLAVQHRDATGLHAREDYTLARRDSREIAVIFEMRRQDIGERRDVRARETRISRHPPDRELENDVGRIPRNRGEVPGNAVREIGVVPSLPDRAIGREGM